MYMYTLLCLRAEILIFLLTKTFDSRDSAIVVVGGAVSSDHQPTPFHLNYSSILYIAAQRNSNDNVNIISIV